MHLLGPLQPEDDEEDEEIVVDIARPEQLHFVIVPGGEPEPEVDDEASPNNRLRVAERVERELPVVLADPALSDSSERQGIRQILTKYTFKKTKLIDGNNLISLKKKKNRTVGVCKNRFGSAY